MLCFPKRDKSKAVYLKKRNLQTLYLSTVVPVGVGLSRQCICLASSYCRLSYIVYTHNYLQKHTALKLWLCPGYLQVLWAPLPSISPKLIQPSSPWYCYRCSAIRNLPILTNNDPNYLICNQLTTLLGGRLAHALTVIDAISHKGYVAGW